MTIPKSNTTVINETQTTGISLETPINNNDIISVDDPALETSTGIKYKIPTTTSIYSTEINDRVNQRIIQVTNFTLLEPAGNVGEIQYNDNGRFTASGNLKWDINNKFLYIGGNINVGNAITTHIEANSNIAFNVGSTDAYQFTTDGRLKTPNYTFPYAAGLNGQTLISDGLGGLFWESVNTPIARINNITGATGVVVHNVTNGFNFSHTNIVSNFTVNVTGLLGLVNDRSVTITLILIQSNPARLPVAFQINGVPYTVNWSDNQSPTGFADKKEIIVYNIFNENSVYKVYGHYTAYGPAS